MAITSKINQGHRHKEMKEITTTGEKERRKVFTLFLFSPKLTLLFKTFYLLDAISDVANA